MHRKAARSAPPPSPRTPSEGALRYVLANVTAEVAGQLDPPHALDEWAARSLRSGAEALSHIFRAERGEAAWRVHAAAGAEQLVQAAASALAAAAILRDLEAKP